MAENSFLSRLDIDANFYDGGLDGNEQSQYYTISEFNQIDSSNIHSYLLNYNIRSFSLVFF